MASYITLGLLAFGLLVEVTPVKINPISWLGSKLNKSISDKVDKLEQRIVELDTKTDMINIEDLATHIASTATLIKNGGLLTDDQYACIFKDMDKWEMYHEKYPHLNGIINTSIEIIKESYKNGR